MIKRWRNAPGEITVEVTRDVLGRACDARTDDGQGRVQSLPSAGVTPPQYGELVIRFTSTGYDDPGRVGGLPENDYPPEGEDEREPVDVYLIDHDCGGARVPVPRDRWQALFDHFSDEVFDAEIEGGA